MSELLNGFNNGRDTTEGIGGQKRIDQVANGVITGEKQCNLPVVMRCTCCGNTTKFSDGAKQQILIEEEYRYIYAVTCDECGKVCDVELFD